MRDLTHSFSVEDAVRLKSTDKAVIISNIRFWLHKNKANNSHIYDGYYWTYNSMKAYSILFPYLTEKKLYNLFKQLEEAGEIKTANYNKSKHNRTKWYTLPNEFKIVENGVPEQVTSISPNEEMEVPKMENGVPELGNCISNTDIKPNINTGGESPPFLILFESLFKKNFDSDFVYQNEKEKKEHVEALEKIFSQKGEKLRKFLTDCFQVKDVFLLGQISPVFILRKINEFSARIKEPNKTHVNFKTYSRAEVEEKQKQPRCSTSIIAVEYQKEHYFVDMSIKEKYGLTKGDPKKVK